MTASTLRHAGAARRAWSSAPTRAVLHVGAVAAVAIAMTAPAAQSIDPATVPDADLARLLRLMAALKAGMLVGALCVLDCRLRRPTAPTLRAGYLGLSWLAAGGVAMIWRLSALGTATLLLHAAGAALIVLACVDREFIPPRD